MQERRFQKGMLPTQPLPVTKNDLRAGSPDRRQPMVNGREQKDSFQHLGERMPR